MAKARVKPTRPQIRALFRKHWGTAARIASAVDVYPPAVSLWLRTGKGPERLRAACEAEARRLMEKSA